MTLDHKFKRLFFFLNTVSSQTASRDGGSNFYVVYKSPLYIFPQPYVVKHINYFFLFPKKEKKSSFQLLPKMPEKSLDYPHSIKLRYVKLGYQYLINNILTFLLVPIMLTILLRILQSSPDELFSFYDSLSLTSIHIICSLFIITYVTTCYIMSRPRTIYLVDYACFRPPITCRIPFASFMEHAHLILSDEPKSVRFQMKILERSGLSEETALPPAMHYIPPTPTMDLAREEAELVIFSAMDSLLAKTGLKPKDIDVLVVNCSLFSPTPSLSAMVINKYKLRSNIKSFNLSGMGCSAGVISIDLARDILQQYPNSNAVVISTEILTPNGYLGKFQI